MPAIRSIVVLVHPLQGLDQGYFLRRIALICWVEAGLRVTVHAGLKNLPEADACILHLDMTELPDDYRAAAQCYPLALNVRPQTIAKKSISRGLLGPDDDYDGPVIVKSDDNHGGLPEARLAAAQKPLSRIAALFDLLARRLPRAWRGWRPGDDYLALPRRSLVPAWVWRRDDLVVETLKVEQKGELFVLRQWFCLGGRDAVSIHLAPDPVVKLSRSVKRLRLSFDVPSEIRQRRAALGLDFGKLDYVEASDGPYLFDVNRTPHNGQRIDRARPRWICRHLAAGLDDYAVAQPAILS